MDAVPVFCIGIFAARASVAIDFVTPMLRIRVLIVLLDRKPLHNFREFLESIGCNYCIASVRSLFVFTLVFAQGLSFHL